MSAPSSGGPVSSCPQCGAPVRFQFSGAVQTTCPYCQSILVRHDIRLELVGKVSDPPPDWSPIQLYTEGQYRGKAFQVVGRIMYEYEHGAWNEWHIVFQDGVSGWLSDAQLEYAVSFLRPLPGSVPQPEDLSAGLPFAFDGVTYEVTTVTKARYRGVQGELPFRYWDKRTCVFADLRTPAAQFGTIDYTENPPLLFLGEVVPFDELQFRNVRLFEGWA